MKTGLLLGVGAVLGVMALLAFQNPKLVGRKATSAVEAAQGNMERLSTDPKVRHNRCIKDVLDRTKCYQSRSQEECGDLIELECPKE